METIEIWGLKATAKNMAEQQTKLMELYKLTGMDIEELVALFAQGYTLEPPKKCTESLADFGGIRNE